MADELEGAELVNAIHHYIEKAKQSVAFHANSTLVLRNWYIGTSINQQILKSERAEYGKEIIANLAEKLTRMHGQGYDRTSLLRMTKFARLFDKQEIVATLSQRLSWSQFVLLIAIEEPIKRDFYAEMCRIEQWNVRALKHQISSSLYERTALSKKPEILIKQQIHDLRAEDKMTPDLIFRDPYYLQLTGLPDVYSESDLEHAILNNITAFMQSLGTAFCFVARQKQMKTEDTDRFLDLLFYNRHMRRLIALELKSDRFQPEHKGQMEWYLNWLDRYERLPGEEKPLGIILCAGKRHTDVEFLSLENSGIHVAEYLLDLPPKEIFEQRLQSAINQAREQYEIQEKSSSQHTLDNKGKDNHE